MFLFSVYCLKGYQRKKNFEEQENLVFQDSLIKWKHHKKATSGFYSLSIAWKNTSNQKLQVVRIFGLPRLPNKMKAPSHDNEATNGPQKIINHAGEVAYR